MRLQRILEFGYCAKSGRAVIEPLSLPRRLVVVYFVPRCAHAGRELCPDLVHVVTMVERISVRRLGIKQLREFFSLTEGPLLCVRPEETHDIHAVQSNMPAIFCTDDDQDSMFHWSPTIENVRPTIHYGARRICPTGHPCESSSVTPRHSQGSNAKEKQHELA